MSTKENKEAIRKAHEEFGEIARTGDGSRIRLWAEKHYAPTYVHHAPGQDKNREQAIEEWKTFVHAFARLVPQTMM